MDAVPFLDYLHEHAATAALGQALAEIFSRRVRRTLQPIPIEVATRIRAAR